VLGLAFTVLAGTYLAIQYLLALRRAWFLVVLAAVAVAEPILLLNASHHPRTSPPSCSPSRPSARWWRSPSRCGRALARPSPPSPPLTQDPRGSPSRSSVTNFRIATLLVLAPRFPIGVAGGTSPAAGRW